jgi:hypothetical protein
MKVSSCFQTRNASNQLQSYICGYLLAVSICNRKKLGFDSCTLDDKHNECRLSQGMKCTPSNALTCPLKVQIVENRRIMSTF